MESLYDMHHSRYMANLDASKKKERKDRTRKDGCLSVLRSQLEVIKKVGVATHPFF